MVVASQGSKPGQCHAMGSSPAFGHSCSPFSSHARPVRLVAVQVKFEVAASYQMAREARLHGREWPRDYRSSRPGSQQIVA